MAKKRVLIATDKLNIGGYDMVAYNFQRNLDPNRFECCYLARGDEPGPLEQRVLDSGAIVYHQPDSTRNYFKSYKYLLKFFNEHEFDIVHSHLTFYSGIVMRAAYKAGIKKRVAHSHFSDPCIENRPFFKRVIATAYEAVMRVWLNRYATDLISCGKEAGEFLYGKKVFEKRGILLNNGVYTDVFSYSNEARERIRKEFEIDDASYVLGHVGRLNYIKNHKFLVDVFYEFQKMHPNSYLLIVGDGEQKESILTKADKLGIKDKVIITGIRNDVSDLYCAMDCFVFPSLKEGFPLTLVEAQGTKLACLISDTVTRGAKINSNVDYISLNEEPKKWAEKAFDLINFDRECVDLTKLYNEFDIVSTTKQLEKIYED